SLNHANICALHDIGHQDGIDFLIMEYLEVETLAACLHKGPCAPARHCATPSRSQMRSIRLTGKASFTKTSSQAISCSRSQERNCSTLDWPRWDPFRTSMTPRNPRH